MSVELQKLRDELFRDALLKGWYAPGHVSDSWSQLVPQERLQRWFARLLTAQPTPILPGGRFLNNFMLGADPEFVFVRHDGIRIDAQQLGLKAGPAFGADNNARLAELRPAPSRTALEVVTSTWLTLRWMAAYTKVTLGYLWRSGAYFDGDGLGGHVHFGRKLKRFRDREVSGLDRLTHLCYVAGLFDLDEGRDRVRHSQGAAHGHYGAQGDIRVQAHGYEYRTFPSQLDNPWLMFLTMTLAKLIVARPEAVPILTVEDDKLTQEQARGHIKMLLAYYSPMDDDARLAFTILAKQGFPTCNRGDDIKISWGIFADPVFGGVPEELPGVLPSMIPAYTEASTEIMNAMFEGRAPEPIPLVVNWSPSELPKGYTQAIQYANTRVAPGLGEFAMQFAMSENCVFHLVGSGGGIWIGLPNNWADRWQRFTYDKPSFQVFNQTDPNILQLNTSKDMNPLTRKEFEKFLLTSGVFPFFPIETVKEDSYKQWMNLKAPSKPKPKKPKRILGSQASMQQIYPATKNDK